MMLRTDIQLRRGRIHHLKAAYPPPLNASGLRLERSLNRYITTIGDCVAVRLCELVA